jgi:hypothetical protein
VVVVALIPHIRDMQVQVVQVVQVAAVQVELIM